MCAPFQSELDALISEVGEAQVTALLKAVRSGNVEFAKEAAGIVADESATIRAAKNRPPAM